MLPFGETKNKESVGEALRTPECSGATTVFAEAIMQKLPLPNAMLAFAMYMPQAIRQQKPQTWKKRQMWRQQLEAHDAAMMKVLGAARQANCWQCLKCLKTAEGVFDLLKHIEITDQRLRQTHHTISPTFRLGKHAGSVVEQLVHGFMHGTAKPEQLPALVMPQAKSSSC